MPQPPEWLKELADAAALLMMPTDVMAPIGCHYCCVDGTWEIALFASSTQIVGGQHDGEERRSRFCLDIQAIRNLMADAHDVMWQSHPEGDDDELGPHVAFGGIYAGERVCLRILAFPPKRFSPGRNAIVYTPAWEEMW